MTVKELIEMLLREDPDAVVRVSIGDRSYTVVGCDDPEGNPTTGEIDLLAE